MRIVVYSLLLLFLLLPLSGCSWIAGAAYLAAPPEKIEAKYELPDKATLVIIDDPRGLVTSPSTLRRIATATRNVLEIEKVVVEGGFVGQDELAGYRSELGDRYNTTSLAALAIHLGARQVIHAEVTGFQMELGGNVIRPAISMNVKVFDLDQRGRVFPMTQDLDSGESFGASVYPLQSQMPARDLAGASASRSIALRDLADQAGRDLARLFFDWRVPEVGSELGRPQ